RAQIFTSSPSVARGEALLGPTGKHTTRQQLSLLCSELSVSSPPKRSCGDAEERKRTSRPISDRHPRQYPTDQGAGKRRGDCTHLLRSKAQWDKTKPKGRCQCHAYGDGEGQGQNYGYIHGKSPLFSDVFSGLARPWVD